eukprot:6212611-Pleurochrysis_carterae.AAC.1
MRSRGRKHRAQAASTRSRWLDAAFPVYFRSLPRRKPSVLLAGEAVFYLLQGNAFAAARREGSVMQSAQRSCRNSSGSLDDPLIHGRCALANSPAGSENIHGGARTCFCGFWYFTVLPSVTNTSSTARTATTAIQLT